MAWKTYRSTNLLHELILWHIHFWILWFFGTIQCFNAAFCPHPRLQIFGQKPKLKITTFQFVTRKKIFLILGQQADGYSQPEFECNSQGSRNSMLFYIQTVNPISALGINKWLNLLNCEIKECFVTWKAFRISAAEEMQIMENKSAKWNLFIKIKASSVKLE